MATELSAAQAGSLAAAMRPLLVAREQRAVAQLVQQHRDGTSTEASMRSGIAEIAALRGLAGDLDANVRSGQAATERDVNGFARSTNRPGR